MGFLDALRHAFAVEKPSPPQPTESQQRLIDNLCRQIVERQLTTPALLFLESVRPLNFITAQSLQFFAPLLSPVGGKSACEDLANFLEHRGSIDILCRRIEELDRAGNTAGSGEKGGDHEDTEAQQNDARTNSAAEIPESEDHSADPKTDPLQVAPRLHES